MPLNTPKLLAAFIISSLAIIAKGQNPVLNEYVNLNVKDLPLIEVLKQIEDQQTLSFAYNPEIIPTRALVSYSVSNAPLFQVLDFLSANYGFTYQLVEQQLVLLPSSEKTSLRYTISGFVRNQESMESLIGATVAVDSTFLGVITNGYGFFSLSLPYGMHRLTISHLGYTNKVLEFDLVKNIEAEIYLVEYAPQLNEIIVRGNSFSLNQVQTGKVNLSPSAISSTPIALGEYDVIKSLETVPGISLQSEGSTFFYVRGGNKDQNLVLIDDAPIYNPTHMLGLFSTIVPGTINAVDIYKSDFPISKGGRLSSVIDIKTKEGNSNHFSGWGNIGLVSTQLGIEGPFKKETSSFLLSGRFSRIKWFFEQELQDLDKFHFFDLTGKANFKLNNKDRLYFSFYTGADQFLTTQSGLGWSNINGTLRWNHLINDHIFVNTTLYGSNYEYLLHLNRIDAEAWRSRIGELGIKSDFSQFIGGVHELSYGVSISGRTINPGNLTVDNIPDNYLVSVKNNIESVVYFQHQIKTGNWGFKYGLRSSLWTSIGEASEFSFNENGLAIDTTEYAIGRPYHNYFRLEPRITSSYTLDNNSIVKLSYGRTVQNLHLITNSISPFTSFEVWLPSGPNIKPQVADQFSFNYSYNLPEVGILIEAESYYKLMRNQIDYKAHAATMLNPTLESELISGIAEAYGTELLIKKETGRIRGMLGYTWSRSKSKFNEQNNGERFNSFSDRPHNLNFMFSYDLGQRFTVGANFIYLSGLPFSSPTSFYDYNGIEVPYYENRNNDRYPAYHRLDLNMKLQLNKRLDSKFQHSLTFSVYNLYRQKNPIFINFNKALTTDGSFVIPSNLYNSTNQTSQLYLFGITPAINYQFRF